MSDNSSRMKIKTWLDKQVKRLDNAGIGTARLDCLVLLEDATGRDRSWLLAHPELPVQGPTLEKLEASIVRRANHEPLAYIRGKTEFYGREFVINQHVLEPRPESETMIELLKQLVASRQLTVNGQLQIADIGTGSGCLAITTKLELPDAKVYATDIDPDCLEVARKNAQTLKADVTFLKGNLLDPIFTAICQPTAIVANLPYVPDDYKLNNAALLEPRLAIFGGTDGLDLYRRLFKHATLRHIPWIFTESLPIQHKELRRVAKISNYKQIKEEDFIQAFQHV